MPADRRLTFDPIAEAVRQWNEHGWADCAPSMGVVTSIMRVQQILLTQADAVLRPFSLTFARYEVLMLLMFSRTGRLPLGKIGERLQVNPGSVTSAVDRLERDGLVTRAPNPADGRGVLAEITARGLRLSQQATERVNATVFSDLGLDAQAQDALYEALRQLRSRAGDFAENELPAQNR